MVQLTPPPNEPAPGEQHTDTGRPVAVKEAGESKNKPRAETAAETHADTEGQREGSNRPTPAFEATIEPVTAVEASTPDNPADESRATPTQSETGEVPVASESEGPKPDQSSSTSEESTQADPQAEISPPAAAAEAQASPMKGRPEIDAGNGDLAQLSDQSMDALVAVETEVGLFSHNGHIAQAVEKQDGTVDIVPLKPDELRHILARSADYYKDKNGERQPAHPPMSAIRDIRASPELPFRPLEALVCRPFVTRGGSIVTCSGYDSETRALLVCDPGLEIPPVSVAPASDELAEAKALIEDDLLGDFPFVAKADLAHAVALLLAPFLRFLVDGATPLHAIDKPNPGTGAGLLLELFTGTCIGRGIGLMSQPASDDEMRKKITSKLITLPSAVIIDNVVRPLDFPSLAAVLTTGYWEDRKLKTSDHVHMPTRGVTWVTTANRLRLLLEMARRTVLIRLDSRMARPWLRDRFRHPKLAIWAESQRGRLIWALLTMIAAYLDRGRPAAANSPTLGSFESWSSVIGGVLQVAGISGFLENTTELYAASDPLGETMRGFFAAWWAAREHKATGVGDVLKLADAAGVSLGNGTDRSRQTRLGMLLRDHANERFIIDGDGAEKLAVELVLAGAGTGNHSGARLWSLRIPPDAADGVSTTGTS